MHSTTAKIFGADSIPVSARDLLEYHEHTRIHVYGGRVVAEQAATSGVSRAYNIPALNLALLLLGPGCSITSEAVSLLSAANVVVGFTGGGLTPLHAQGDYTFLTTASEYRPTEYMQHWVKFWLDDHARNKKAQDLLRWRFDSFPQFWDGNKDLHASGFCSDSFFQFASNNKRIDSSSLYASTVIKGGSDAQLLGQEGNHFKKVYQYCAQQTKLSDFVRNQSSSDSVNSKLTMGNYIAYGLAAVALSALGISFAFPLLHGKTRRGGLVFDIADVIKDSVVAPYAFLLRDETNDEFRRRLKTVLLDRNVLPYLINGVKALAQP